MGHCRARKSAGRPPSNQRRTRKAFEEVLGGTKGTVSLWENRRGKRRTRKVFEEVLGGTKGAASVWENRRGKRREGKSMRAAIAAAGPEEEEMGEVGWPKRLLRWALGLLILPFCLVTAWTLVQRFSQAALHQQLWQSAELWHFAIGVLVMLGWFWSGLMHGVFLKVYVFGHEFTHALVVTCLGGKVSEFHVSEQGGYITTNKTNWVIALSPYFLPIWSMEAAVLYGLLKVFATFSTEWDKLFYAVIGLTWTFHMVWTLWMLPREQPDLQENGTFLSLVLIGFGNVLVLAGLLCVAGHGSLWEHFQGFGRDWLRYTATWGDAAWRWANIGIGWCVRQGAF